MTLSLNYLHQLKMLRHIDHFNINIQKQYYTKISYNHNILLRLSKYIQKKVRLINNSNFRNLLTIIDNMATNIILHKCRLLMGILIYLVIQNSYIRDINFIWYRNNINLLPNILPNYKQKDINPNTNHFPINNKLNYNQNIEVCQHMIQCIQINNICNLQFYCTLFMSIDNNLIISIRSHSIRKHNDCFSFIINKWFNYIINQIIKNVVLLVEYQFHYHQFECHLLSFITSFLHLPLHFLHFLDFQVNKDYNLKFSLIEYQNQLFNSLKEFTNCQQQIINKRKILLYKIPKLFLIFTVQKSQLFRCFQLFKHYL